MAITDNDRADVAHEVVEELASIDRRDLTARATGEPWTFVGDPHEDPGMKLGVLMEEVGEAAKDVIERNDTSLLRRELVQVAAVASQWAATL